MPTVKIRTNRQVTVPKVIFDGSSGDTVLILRAADPASSGGGRVRSIAQVA